MADKRVKPGDWMMAEATELLSGLSTYFPAITKKVAGSPAPSYWQLRWKRAPMVASDIDWTEFPGVSAAGRTPHDYPEAATLYIDRERADAYQMQFGGRQAVAYALGSAVMVGIAESDRLFRVNLEDKEQYHVAMRIGKGPLKATAGLWLTGGVALWTPEQSFKSLHPIVSAGPIVPVEMLPANIPLV